MFSNIIFLLLIIFIYELIDSFYKVEKCSRFGLFYLNRLNSTVNRF